MSLKDTVKYYIYKVPGTQSLWTDIISPELKKIKHERKFKEWKRNLKNFNRFGITSGDQKRGRKIIVSLTSYPKRMNEVPYVVCSLLRQTLKPDEVILNLSTEEFPNQENDLEEELLRLRSFGLTINWCQNIRSYKKLIPTMEKYSDDIIITVDDDVYYPENLVETLYNGYMENENAVICLRARRIGHRDSQIVPYIEWNILQESPRPATDILQTGVGGVLYPPGSLYKDIDREDIFMKICPIADDIWFWAMSVLGGLKIKVISTMTDLDFIDPDEQEGPNTLTYKNVDNGQNDVAFAAVLKEYPELKKILLSTSERCDENGGGYRG